MVKLKFETFPNVRYFAKKFENVINVFDLPTFHHTGIVLTEIKFFWHVNQVFMYALHPI